MRGPRALGVYISKIPCGHGITIKYTTLCLRHLKYFISLREITFPTASNQLKQLHISVLFGLPGTPTMQITLPKIQRRAARWMLNDYSRYSSVTSVLQQLQWPTLKERRKLDYS